MVAQLHRWLKTPLSTPKQKKVKALWSNPSFTTIFCDLCVEEIEAGNRKKKCASFSPEGWNNLVSKFYNIIGKNYDKDQLKNR